MRSRMGMQEEFQIMSREEGRDEQFQGPGTLCVGRQQRVNAAEWSAQTE